MSAVEPWTIKTAWQDLLDKDDRTSPEGKPDMALITRDELAEYMRAHPAPAMEAEPVAWQQKTSDGWIFMPEGWGPNDCEHWKQYEFRPVYAHPQDAESLRGEVVKYHDAWLAAEGKHSEEQARAEKAEAKRDAALARVAEVEAERDSIAAGAFQAAAEIPLQWLEQYPHSETRKSIALSIRALTPTDAKAALDAMVAAALTPQPDAGLEAQFLPTEDGEFNGNEWDGDITPEEQGMIDAAWEKHKAARPAEAPAALRSRPVGEVKPLLADCADRLDHIARWFETAEAARNIIGSGYHQPAIRELSARIRAALTEGEAG